MEVGRAAGRGRGGEKKSWMSLNGSHYNVCGTKSRDIFIVQAFVTSVYSFGGRKCLNAAEIAFTNALKDSFKNAFLYGARLFCLLNIFK